MIGKTCLDQVNDDLFSGDIRIGDQITVPFNGELTFARVSLCNVSTGSPGGLYGGL